MELDIKFGSIDNKPITLPTEYNRIVYAMLLSQVSSKLSTFLHNEGYPLGKKTFKCFTFSRLIGNIISNKNHKIKFGPKISLVINSPDDKVMNELVLGFNSRRNTIRLLGNNLKVTEFSFISTPELDDDIIPIETLSPITMCKKMKNGKTLFISPKKTPAEFSDLIKKNLCDKSQAFNGKVPNTKNFEIKPIDVHSSGICIHRFDVEGWSGKFYLRGDPELLKFAYECGLGSRNSYGFGAFHVVTK